MALKPNTDGAQKTEYSAGLPQPHQLPTQTTPRSRRIQTPHPLSIVKSPLTGQRCRRSAAGAAAHVPCRPWPLAGYRNLRGDQHHSATREHPLLRRPGRLRAVRSLCLEHDPRPDSPRTLQQTGGARPQLMSRNCDQSSSRVSTDFCSRAPTKKTLTATTYTHRNVEFGIGSKPCDRTTNSLRTRGTA